MTLPPYCPQLEAELRRYALRIGSPIDGGDFYKSFYEGVETRPDKTKVEER